MQCCVVYIWTLKLYCCVADDDYDSGTFDVTFGAGETSAEVSININDDSIDEESEEFRLVFRSTPIFVQIAGPPMVTGIIDDNDEPGMCVRGRVHACMCLSVCN